jgi:serpin B
MGLTTELRYARTGSYQALDVPYALSTLSMLVVMPPRGALPGFQRRLTPGVLAGIERSLKSRRIQLRMPKFHVLAHDDLVPALSALGMPVAFSDRADFSGITTEVPLKIGAVQHAADLRVDEQGTIAAAATGLSMGATSAVPQPAVDVTLDHPFLLFLRDDATGAILFAGRITDPTRG